MYDGEEEVDFLSQLTLTYSTYDLKIVTVPLYFSFPFFSVESYLIHMSKTASYIYLNLSSKAVSHIKWTYQLFFGCNLTKIMCSNVCSAF